MSLPNPDATLLDILSPPKSTSTDDRYARIAGRFGYQMCADIISFAQNLPQRLLLIDQLQKLPELFFELLQEENMQQVIRKVIDSDQIPVWTIEEVQDHIERSYTQLEKIAQHAWVSAKNCRNINTTQPDQEGSIEDKLWWRVLLKMLPHLEQKIWLTDISAPFSDPCNNAFLRYMASLHTLMEL